MTRNRSYLYDAANSGIATCKPIYSRPAHSQSVVVRAVESISPGSQRKVIEERTGSPNHGLSLSMSRRATSVEVSHAISRAGAVEVM